jgi:tRNA(His) 5'-end guanylyltransferase
MYNSAYAQYSNISRLSDHYGFVKPNDRRALDLMNAAAVEVMKDLPDLCIAYGVSDEFRYSSYANTSIHFNRSPLPVLYSILIASSLSGVMGESYTSTFMGCC